MSPKPKLRLDWASHKAAEYAVRRWHYSKCMPRFKTVKVGVWEDGRFIGVVIFSAGANKHIGRPYGLGPFQACELTRVALADHETPVTRIISIAVKLLKRQSPRLRAIVSYADANEGHHGGIYQGGNWIYTGQCAAERGVVLHGKLTHRRTINTNYESSDIEWLRKHVDPNARRIVGLPKHKYVMPLDDEIRDRVIKLAKPYPKRDGSIDSDAPGIQPDQGGASPTPSLQNHGP